MAIDIWHEHPKTLEEVRSVFVVRSPAFALTDSLASLVLDAPASLYGNKANFKALRDAYTKSPSLQLGPKGKPHLVSNAPIPSSWVTDYKLQIRRGGPRRHHFIALVHFGTGHFTPNHFETCAATTHGCLLFRRKLWEFRPKFGEPFHYIQEQGETVYIPPGMIHNVKTLSNGGLIIGETQMTSASPAAFVERAALLVTGPKDGRHDPEEEARLLCDTFDIHVSQTATQQGGHQYGGPAMRCLRRTVAAAQGGTRRTDALERKRRTKSFNTRTKRNNKN